MSKTGCVFGLKEGVSDKKECVCVCVCFEVTPKDGWRESQLCGRWCREKEPNFVHRITELNEALHYAGPDFFKKKKKLKNVKMVFYDLTHFPRNLLN